MSTLMFEPLTDEAEIQATISNRINKGYADTFLKGLDTAYKTYRKENPNGHFIVPLNEREGSAFHGKSTDSLYQTLLTALKRNSLQTEYRLVRIKKDEDTFLRIVKL